MLVFGLTFVSKVLVRNIFLVTVPISYVRATWYLKILWFTYESTEETRIRWIQTQNSAEVLFTKIKEVVNSGVYRAEEALHRLLSLLTGGWEDSKGKSNEDAGYGDAKSEWEETKKSGDAFETSAEWAEDIVDKAKEKLGEKVKVGGEKMKVELWKKDSALIISRCVSYVPLKALSSICTSTSIGIITQASQLLAISSSTNSLFPSSHRIPVSLPVSSSLRVPVQ